MDIASSAPIANLPYPLMANALTGTASPAVPLASLAGDSPDLPGADQRIAGSTHLATDYSVDDPNDLTQTGWCILFASDADPAIQAQLQPLIDLRQKQVQDPNLFKVFSGADKGGVLPGQTAASWARQRGSFAERAGRSIPGRSALLHYDCRLAGTHPLRVSVAAQNAVGGGTPGL